AELFRQSTGMSPHRFVLGRRVDRAKELLRNPALSVLDVALQTGFTGQSHFTKVFRRIAGPTPSQFRAGLWPPYLPFLRSNGPSPGRTGQSPHCRRATLRPSWKTRIGRMKR